MNYLGGYWPNNYWANNYWPALPMASEPYVLSADIELCTLGIASVEVRFDTGIADVEL